MTENHILKQFEEHLLDVGKSEHTVRAYTLDMYDLIKWFEQSADNSFEPGAVGPRDIVEYRSFLIARGKKPATVNRHLVAAKRFFHWALNNDVVSDSPFEGLESIRVRQQADLSPKWLPRRKQLALLRAVRKASRPRDLAMIELMMNAGLRVSEVANLTLTDVELGERSGYVTIRNGKGNKYRQVPLARDTRQALKRYLNRRDEDSSQRLFLGQRGPLNTAGVQNVVAKYAYQARLANVTPHTLRHTFGKNLVDEGVSLDQVAALLGHESLDTVMIYTRPSRKDLENAVRKAAGEVL